MINWISSIIAGGGAGWIASVFHEAYCQRRATQKVYEFDQGLE